MYSWLNFRQALSLPLPSSAGFLWFLLVFLWFSLVSFGFLWFSQIVLKRSNNLCYETIIPEDTRLAKTFFQLKPHHSENLVSFEKVLFKRGNL